MYESNQALKYYFHFINNKLFSQISIQIYITKSHWLNFKISLIKLRTIQKNF
jgi:hypothetical protein